MIRRHATPALVAFCALLAGCFSRRMLGDSPFILLVPAAASAALAIPLFKAAPAALRRAGALAAAACIGFLLATAMLGRIWVLAHVSRPPVELGEITGFTARLGQDSALTQSSRTILRATTCSVASERLRVEVEARVSVLVVIDGDYRFSQGQMIEVRAGLAPLQGQDREAFIAYAGRADVRTIGFSHPVWDLRSRLRDGIHRSISLIGYPASALMEALLTGGREDIPPELSDGFKRTGSLHILALSGLHAAVIYGFVSLLLAFSSRRWLKFILGTAVLAVYQFMAGPIPSLARAVVMLVTGGAAMLLDRDSEPLNLLAIAGILILVIDPYQAWSLSFQLSFLSLLGLIALAPLLAHPLEGYLPPALLMPLSVSVAAQIATLPVVASAFGVYYPSGLVAGLILVPLTTLMLWLGLAWLLISPVVGSVIHHAAAGAFGALYELIMRSAGFISRFPAITIGREIAPLVSTAAAIVLATLCFLPPMRPRSRAFGRAAL
jgi:competence protein ComEC